jgi:hypothetical protein
MKLSKSDALLLHAVLFKHLTNTHSQRVETHHEDLLYKLEGYLLDDVEDEEEDVEVEDDSVEDVEAEDEYEVPEPDEFKGPSVLAKLPAVSVTSPAGDKVTLEFEDVGDADTVDVLLDDGSVILDRVCCIKLTDKSVELFDSEECHAFQIKKLPKTWSKVLQPGVLYGVDSSLDVEEE